MSNLPRMAVVPGLSLRQVAVWLKSFMSTAGGVQVSDSEGLLMALVRLRIGSRKRFGEMLL